MDHHDGHDLATIENLLQEMLILRADIVDESASEAQQISEAHKNHKNSAWNLLNYLALRRRDLRPLQQRLAALGFSSLGGAERHVLATIDAVLSMLHLVAGRTWEQASPVRSLTDFETGLSLLAEHTQALLGDAPPERGVRIMVTMPTTAADDYDLVYNLLAQGMDCIRINCANDDATVWSRIILNLRLAEKTLQRSCRVAMDLGGPKLRTGPIAGEAYVLKVRPERDMFGRVTAPARIWLTAADVPDASLVPSHSWLVVAARWLARLREGDRVNFIDARDSRRSLTIVEVGTEGCWAEVHKTAYITCETVLRRTDHSGKSKPKGQCRDGRVLALPPLEDCICLHQDDLLTLTRDLAPGCCATFDHAGQLLKPATVGCTIAEVFDCVQAGEAIWFDDGKIGGVIDKVEENAIHVVTTQVPPGGAKLRANKGINLPDSVLRLPTLTPKDIDDLAFVVEHADMVQLSFPNTADDVALLQDHIAQLGGKQPAIVLKIETRRGFDHLPAMLLAALRSPTCGVMIARGDLAVECGFERMAEVQEEILWICEAAHVPVIWATQVLETLSRTGMPSRAEVTDAAMADRAECVMLNKGPHVLDAVRVLDAILRRMQGHQSKKQPLLRRLQLAHGTNCGAATAPGDT